MQCFTLTLQLSPVTKFPTLNMKDGERALLVKDYYGDWGVIIGKWLGYRKGVPGKPGERLEGYHWQVGGLP